MNLSLTVRNDCGNRTLLVYLYFFTVVYNVFSSEFTINFLYTHHRVEMSRDTDASEMYIEERFAIRLY